MYRVQIRRRTLIGLGTLLGVLVVAVAGSTQGGTTIVRPAAESAQDQLKVSSDIARHLPSNAAIAYTDHHGDVWLRHFNGSTAQRILAGKNIYSLKWLGDGRNLLCASRFWTLDSRLYLINALTKKVEDITAQARRDESFQYLLPSPDHRWVATVRRHHPLGGGGRPDELVLIDLKTREFHTISSITDTARVITSVDFLAWWAGDGSLVASVDAPGPNQLVQYFPEKRTRRTIYATPSGNVVSDFAIHKGRYAFTDNSATIYSVSPTAIRDSRGKVVFQAGEHEVLAGLQWSPRGEALYFFSRSHDSPGQGWNHRLWRLQFGDRNKSLVSDWPAGQSAPLWSPDGEWFTQLFVKDRNTSLERSDPHGNKRRIIVRGPDVCYEQPRWLGRILVFWKTTSVSSNEKREMHGMARRSREVALYGFDPLANATGPILSKFKDEPVSSPGGNFAGQGIAFAWDLTDKIEAEN